MKRAAVEGFALNKAVIALESSKAVAPNLPPALAKQFPTCRAHGTGSQSQFYAQDSLVCHRLQIRKSYAPPCVHSYRRQPDLVPQFRDTKNGLTEVLGNRQPDS